MTETGSGAVSPGKAREREVGSKWHKWDLHCHTPLDKRWSGKPGPNQQDEFVDEYIQTAQEAGLRVIAVTDHYWYRDHSFTTQFVAKLVAKSRVLDDFTVLPGFEITVRDLKGIHVLVIFPEDQDLSQLDRLFSSFHDSKKPPDARDKVYPAKVTLQELHETLYAETERFVMGFAHADENNGILESRKLTAIDTWKFPHVRFVQFAKPPGGISKFCQQATQPKYKKDIWYRPIVHVVASDCASLTLQAAGGHHLGSKYTWFKCAPSFDGLLQVLLDPKYRIKYGDAKPGAEPRMHFREIQLATGPLWEDDPVEFEPRTLPLNRDMVAIIGGRGSGKSVLLSVLEKLHPRDIGHEKHAQSVEAMNLGPSFHTQLVLTDGREKQTTPDDPEKVGYMHICQAEVKELCEKPVKMTSHIELLLGIEPFQLEGELENRTREATARYWASRGWLEQDDDEGLINDRSRIGREIQETGRQIALWTTDEVREDVEKIQEHSTTLHQLEAARTDLMAANEKYRAAVDTLGNCLQKVNQLLGRDGSIKPISTRETAGQVQQFQDEIATRIQALNDEISASRTRLQEGGVADAEFRSGQLEKMANTVEDLKKRLQAITKHEKQMKGAFTDLGTISNRIDAAMSTYEVEVTTRWEEVRDKKFDEKSLQDVHDRLVRHMQLEPVRRFDEDSFYDFMKDCLHLGRFRGPNRRQQLKDLFQVTDPASFFCLIRDDKMIKIAGTEPLRLSEFLEMDEYFKKNGQQELLNGLYDVRNLLSFCTVISVPRFMNKGLAALSMGERGTMFLRLKLATATFSLPFVFDQPEDDLDNDFIQTELVPLLRDIKQYRQVIIATHNANLVVNCCAEQIIWARNEDQVLKYTIGGIEHAEVRKGVCDVLEGGKDALRQRYIKYGIKPPTHWMQGTE